MADISGTFFESYTPPVTSIPSVSSTPTTSVGASTSEGKTKEEILKRLGWFSSYPHVREVIGKIDSLDLNWVSSHDREQMELIFGFMHGISDSDMRVPYELEAYTNRAEWIYRNYVTDADGISKDAKKAAERIIPARLMWDESWDLFKDIEDLFMATNDMDSDEILGLAQEIQIDSPNIDKDDWDSFFSSLFARIDKDTLFTSDESEELKKFIKEFKKNSPLYENGLDIEVIDDYLDGILSDVEKAWENDTVTVQIGGHKPLLFETKKWALQFVYKMKLVLQKLDKADFSFAAFIWSIVDFEGVLISPIDDIFMSWWDAHWILWIFSTIAAWAYTWALIYAHARVIYGPIESVKRNVKDVIAINFWGKDKDPNPNGFLTSEKPLSWFWKVFFWRHRLFKILKHAKEMYDDPLSAKLQVSIFDGLSSANDWQEDIRTKQLSLSFFEKKYQDDPHRLEQLNRLRGNRILWLEWWRQYSNSKTFWLRLKAIDEGLEYPWRAWQVFDLNSNIKWPIVEQVNKAFADGRSAIWKLYEGLPEDNTKWFWLSQLEKLDKTDFFKYVEATIDLDGTLSNTDERTRNKLIKEFLGDIIEWRVHTNPDEITQEIMRIADWKLPKFKIIKLLWKEIHASNWPHKKDFNKLLRETQNDNWIVTQAEFDTMVRNIQWWTYAFARKAQKYTDVEINDAKNKWEDLYDKRYSIPEARVSGSDDFVRLFNHEREIALMLDDSLAREDLGAELEKLYKDIKVQKWKTTIDYTQGHFHHIVTQILTWKKYDVAKRPYASEVEFDTANTDYESKSKITKELRSKLLWNIRWEIIRIEWLGDEQRRVEDFEKLQKRYKDFFEASWELQTELKDDSSWYYKDIMQKHAKLQHELWNFYSDYVAVDWRKLDGKAKDFYDTAIKLDRSKKGAIDAVRNRAFEPDTKIALVQFENALRGIIAGDITIAQAKTLDFTLYDDDSALSQAAKKTVLRSAEAVDIYSPESYIRNSTEVFFTPESKFKDAVNAWNSFAQPFDKWNELLALIRSREDLEMQKTVLDTRLKGVRPSEVDVTDQTKLTSFEDNLKSTRERISDLKWVTGDLKTLSSIELEYKLATREIGFKKQLASNPGFQNYAVEKWIDPNSTSADVLWGDFMDYWKSNTIQKWSTRNFTIDAAVKRTPPPTNDTVSVKPRTLHQEAEDLVSRIFYYHEISGDKIETVNEFELKNSLFKQIDATNSSITSLSDLESQLQKSWYEIKSNEEIANYVESKLRIRENIASDLKAAASKGTDDLITFIRKNARFDRLWRIIS